MAESGMSARNLHCYAEGVNGDWEAICLDLDIAVQGASFEEVSASLRKAVALYLQSVGGLPERDRHAMLNRAAPFSVRVKFLAHAFRELFVASADRERHQFTMAT
jgi:hypothetical protein